MPLDPKLIEQLYATRRVKGGYLSILTQALESDENGFAAKETYPQLKDKASATIYQGFRNAAEKMGVAEKVTIINSDNEVYVLFNERVTLAAEPAATNGK